KINCFVPSQNLATFVGLPFKERALYNLIFIEMLTIFHLLIEQCAKVVSNNSRFQVENRRFYLGFQQNGQNRLVTVRHLMKAESFLLPRRLHSYAFKLYDNSRITSKTFQLVIRLELVNISKKIFSFLTDLNLH